jgi:hypothetical protein
MIVSPSLFPGPKPLFSQKLGFQSFSSTFCVVLSSLDCLRLVRPQEGRVTACCPTYSQVPVEWNEPDSTAPLPTHLPIHFTVSVQPCFVEHWQAFPLPSIQSICELHEAQTNHLSTLQTSRTGFRSLCSFCLSTLVSLLRFFISSSSSLLFVSSFNVSSFARVWRPSALSRSAAANS